MTKDVHAATEKLFLADAKLRAVIAKQGDRIARDHGYPGLSGIDAVYRYLIDTHHWLPCQVRALSTEDLGLLLDGHDA